MRSKLPALRWSPFNSVEDQIRKWAKNCQRPSGCVNSSRCDSPPSTRPWHLDFLLLHHHRRHNRFTHLAALPSSRRWNIRLRLRLLPDPPIRDSPVPHSLTMKVHFLIIYFYNVIRIPNFWSFSSQMPRVVHIRCGTNAKGVSKSSETLDFCVAALLARNLRAMQQVDHPQRWPSPTVAKI